jgi:hypothetical protein
VAVDLGRLELGREALRRLAPGRVLALEAVCGLDAAPFGPPFRPFLVPPFRTVLVLAVPPFGLAAVPVRADVPVRAAVPVRADVPLRAEVPERDDVPVRDELPVRAEVPVRAPPLVRDDVLVRDEPPARAEVPVFDREVDRLGLVRDDRVVDGREELADDPLREAAERLVPDRLVPGRRAEDERLAAGRAGAAGLAVDMVLAAEVSALAAVVMALVALFMACIAVDMVLADVLALVAAWVILVAAEVTLVAADETVRAALAGVAVELRLVERVVLRAALPVLREPVLREPVLRDVVPRDAVLVLREPVLRDAALRLAVLRAVRLDADLAAVPRADVLVAAVAAGRAELREALVLADRVLPEFAGLRWAAARVVVCTDTEFPPS